MIPVLATIIALTNACGMVSVDLHGARVTSYVPVGGEEVFFTSKTGVGGVPICWPWFGGLGPSADSRRHGIARYRDFKVMKSVRPSYCDKELILRLESDAETRRLFPHDFALTVSVRLSVVSGSLLFSRKSCIPTKTSSAGMTVSGKEESMGLS